MPYRYRNKYGNKSVQDPATGQTFDSQMEFRHWQALLLRKAAGEITELIRQVPFRIEVNGQYICDYVADMVYYDLTTERQIVVDVKGARTDVYRLKKKLVRACYGIEITEVTADEIR